MSKPTLSDAHILDSVAGEEDPGASLDVVRNMVIRARREARSRAAMQPPPEIHIDCAQDGEVITVDVGWPCSPAEGISQPAPSTADLLGLVVAHHSAIANTAWARFHTTGQRRVALEVDEDADGVFYVNLKDA